MTPRVYVTAVSLTLGASLAVTIATDCRAQVDNSANFSTPPAWAQDAIWYQVLVERFRNGDPGNDPTLADVQPGSSDSFPAGWTVTDWGHDWYAREPWMDRQLMGDTGFYRGVQLRRYGGDLQGVLDKLTYLDSLGITAIYFNPLNDAPSLHKYDARHYRHIDRNFGPDPRRDAAAMASEDPLDPDTWVVTSADSLFLAVVDSAHALGLRVVVDFSWNHTGADFWALDRLRGEGSASPLADWYEVTSWDDPATPDTSEFAYEGWFGVESLPVLAEDNEPLFPERYAPTDIQPLSGGFESDRLREHIFTVTRRWLDPDGDGDPGDGVDGFRLDVAAEVGVDFWREYRRVVRAINPEAYLVGEVWYARWPHHIIDPAVYLRGDMFDAVMNYRWHRLARGAIARRPPLVEAAAFAEAHAALFDSIATPFRRGMMNVVSTHDSPRLLTSVGNDNAYKVHANPREDPAYVVWRPGAGAEARARLLIAHQFSWVGAPHVFYGEEWGMWGADDPDNRKPMIWPDVVYAAEAAHPFGRERAVDRPGALLGAGEGSARGLNAFYRQVIRLRRELAPLRRGEVRYLPVDPPGVVAYERVHRVGTVAVYLNTAGTSARLLGVGGEPVLLSAGATLDADRLTLEGRGFAWLLR